MRTVLGILTLAASLVAAPAVAAPASAPGDIRPGTLPRGEDVRIAHVVGTTVVDGDTRIPIGGSSAQLLGRAGEGYVVQTDGTVVWVTPDDRRRLARLRDGTEALLSDDGEEVVLTRVARGGRTTVRVITSITGQEVATRTFRRYAVAMGAADNRVLLSASAPARTFWWRIGPDDVRRVVARAGGRADIEADRLGTFTGDPYRGGCFVLTTLSRPVRTLWRSCREAVIDFSPDGTRMVTADLLADGLGPGRVWVRRADGGRLLARHSAYWFSDVRWETDRALLLDTHTKRRWATVRCVGDDCERASKLHRQRM